MNIKIDKGMYQIMYIEMNEIKTGKCTLAKLNDALKDIQNDDQITLISITLLIG